MSGFLFGNIRGIYPKCNKTKKDYIYDLAEIERSDYIILTESHLNSEINDCEVALDGFQIHRCDRTGRTHGGVMMYTKNNL